MARNKIKLGRGFYMYPRGGYVRKKLAPRRGCKTYRVREVKPGRKVLLCIRDKKGPRGGRTKAVSLLRSLKTKPKDKAARRAIMKAKKKYRKKTKKRKKMK